MIPANLRKSLTTLFKTVDVPSYFVDEAPPFKDAPNQSGFFVWETDNHGFFECSEGFGYSGVTTTTNSDNYITLQFELTVTCYSGRFSVRSSISKLIMNLFYPIVSGVRTPLRGLAIADGYINFVHHISTQEYDIQKSGQSTPELSAAVMSFDCSFSVKE